MHTQGFGGQTLTYGGLSLRASPAAFDKWPNITFDEMLLWYKKSEASTWACGNVAKVHESHNCDNSGFMNILLQEENAYPKIVYIMPRFCAKGTNGTNHLWLDTTNTTEIDYNDLYTSRAFCGPPQVFLNQTTTSRCNRHIFLPNTYYLIRILRYVLIPLLSGLFLMKRRLKLWGQKLKVLMVLLLSENILF
jgi:hypothetical protein